MVRAATRNVTKGNGNQQNLNEHLQQFAALTMLSSSLKRALDTGLIST
jgi:hypothetical protein